MSQLPSGVTLDHTKAEPLTGFTATRKSVKTVAPPSVTSFNYNRIIQRFNIKTKEKKPMQKLVKYD